MTIFTTEKSKERLRQLQSAFIKKVSSSLASSDPVVSIAALGLQKARIDLDHHWPDEETGYWKRETYSSNKPPRWILQMRRDGSNNLEVDYARKGGEPNAPMLANADAVCCLNTSSSAPSAGVCAPVWIAVRDGNSFTFPEDWSWLLVLRFSKGVRTATANQALQLNLSNRTAATVGRGSITTPVTLSRVLHIDDISTTAQCDGVEVTYQDATEALRKFVEFEDTGEEGQNAA